jgi:cysteine-rich repeat protein
MAFPAHRHVLIPVILALALAHAVSAGLVSPSADTLAVLYFDEGSGSTASDSSGNGNTGGISGATYKSTGCVHNSCLHFDGIDDRASLATLFDNPPATWSVSLWVRPEQLAASDCKRFFSKRQRGDESYGPVGQFCASFPGFPNCQRFNFFFANAVTDWSAPAQQGWFASATDSNPIQPNNWYHYAGTFDGTKARLYINGQLAAEDDSINFPSGTYSDFGLGFRIFVPDSYFKGDLDEFTAFSKALSAAEVQQLYQQGLAAGASPVGPPPTGVCPALTPVTFTSSYEASSGLFPQDVCPAWFAGDSATPENPAIVNGKLILSTSSGSEAMAYSQSGFVTPYPFVFEARMKVVSDSGPPSRSSSMIRLTTASQRGAVLVIRPDQVNLLSNDLTVGASANVDTNDAFHTYRIEIDANSVVEVYYDGVLLFTGSLFTNAATFGTDTNIAWGSFSSFAYGISEWEFVRHNAMACPAVCGNGEVEGDEQCDDGNTEDGDCCSAACQDEPAGSQTCGVGACQVTTVMCSDGAPAACVPGTPSPESCNGLDDDCDGTADDVDADGDGLNDCGTDQCPSQSAIIAGVDRDANNDGCPDDPAELISEIEAAMQSGDIPAGIGNSLKAKVQAALNSYANGKDNAGNNQLGAFINELNSQKGKKVPAALADLFAAKAQNIIAQHQDGGPTGGAVVGNGWFSRVRGFFARLFGGKA